ncbi:LOW QUALITY PROTEIN: Crinkler (CRN) family protein [Phytophthora palmivora]|uniref:Crinkler (CRN) family protein n=1 Tax=Phytophthora palmivora TaxID=4796 RepID=A0A2P4YA92_9STRA|nr:LOW QUALITY PROTEIN: Crinkler (CRN) family protein [Phytophthora palmivora]
MVLMGMTFNGDLISADRHAGTFDVTIDDDEKVSVLKKVIKDENPATIKCDAKDLQLFLTKKDGAWLTEADVKKGVEDTTGFTPLDVAGAPLNLVDLSEKDVRCQLTKEAVEAKKTPVHVLVVVPKRDGTSNEMSAATTPLTVEQVAEQVEMLSGNEMRRRLLEADVKKGVEDTTGFTPLDVAGAPLNLVDLSEKDVRCQLTKEAVEAKKTPVHVLVVVPKRDGTSNEMSAATTPLTVEQVAEQVEMSVNKAFRERDEKASAYSFSDLNIAMKERIVKKMRLTENIPDVKEPKDNSIAGYSWIPKITESEESQRVEYMAYLQQHLKTLIDRGDFLLDDIAGDKEVLNIVDPRLPFAMNGTADVLLINRTSKNGKRSMK